MRTHHVWSESKHVTNHVTSRDDGTIEDDETTSKMQLIRKNLTSFAQSSYGSLYSMVGYLLATLRNNQFLRLDSTCDNNYRLSIKLLNQLDNN